MIAVRRHVNLLIKKVAKEDLVGEESFDFSVAEGKWLQGFQYALVEEEEWDPWDLEFTQLLYRGSKGDVIVDDIASEVNGAGTGALDKAFDAEDFGFEKGSDLESQRRSLLGCMMTNREYDNVFADEYASIAEYDLHRKTKDVFVREECPYYSSLLLSEEFGRKKLDFDTFIGFELWYDSMEIDESHIVELEIPDPDDPSDEPDMITVQRISNDFLYHYSSDGEYDKLNLVGFGICKGAAEKKTKTAGKGAVEKKTKKQLLKQLFNSVFIRDADAIKELIIQGVDVNGKDTSEMCPLIFAAEVEEGRSLECVKLLLEAGADVNAKNCIGETPLFRAVGSDNPECVKLLLEAGADVNAKDQMGQTPLFRAVRGNPECVKLLLEAGADVNVEDNMGRTPFDGMGSDEIVALLTE